MIPGRLAGAFHLRYALPATNTPEDEAIAAAFDAYPEDRDADYVPEDDPSPYDWPAGERGPLLEALDAAVEGIAVCPVTMPGRVGGRSRDDHRCGDPVDRYGLCARHADDHDRLCEGGCGRCGR